MAGKGPQGGHGGFGMRKVSEPKAWVDVCHFQSGILARLIRYVRLRHAYTILHYTFLTIFVFGVISGGNQHGHVATENGFVRICHDLSNSLTWP